MATTTLPVAADGPGPGEATVAGGPAVRRRAGKRPDRPGPAVGLYRVAVVPLWGDHFRVNVLTGTEPTDVRTPHSYFVTADCGGAILASTPRLQKVY